MRGGRSLLVLLVLAVGLGAYIYFVESKRDLTDPETRKDKVFAVETGKIEEVELRSPNGDTTLRKNGTTWQIVAPVAAAADEYTVSSLVSALETLEVQRTLAGESDVGWPVRSRPGSNLGRVQGRRRRDAAPAERRQQDADGLGPVRADRGTAEALSDRLAPRGHTESFDVRPA